MGSNPTVTANLLSGLFDTITPMTKEKKKRQLGMDPGTASHRLKIDLLFFAFGHQRCVRCRKPLSRSDFSIDHVKPWLDSEDPVGLFFDLGNIAFSHKKCNYGNARSRRKKHFTEEDRKEARRINSMEYRKRNPGRYSRLRREHYLKTGN